MAKILLGLDIGTTNIKAVQVSRDKNSYSLIAAGFIPAPSKGQNLNNTGEEQLLASSINRLVHDMKISTADVSASLPSSKVVTRIIDVPLMSDRELSSSIQWEAEQYIPLPLAKVKIDYTIISKDEQAGKMKILLIAAPIETIEKYMRIISLSGLNPISLETDILAACRSITISFPTLTNTIVVSIGATTTEVAILNNQIPVFTKSIPLGGSTLTQAIASELGFEMPQAEEYKKTYGLDEDKLEGKVGKSITPHINSILGELEKTAAYFKDLYSNEDIKSITVCGGGAKLPGLVLTLTKSLGLDSQISDPFINIDVDPHILPSLSPDAPLYTQAVGLALKEIT